MRRHSPNLEWDARCEAYSVRCTAIIECRVVQQSLRVYPFHEVSSACTLPPLC
jgi:hypothetical protein